MLNLVCLNVLLLASNLSCILHDLGSSVLLHLLFARVLMVVLTSSYNVDLLSCSKRSPSLGIISTALLAGFRQLAGINCSKTFIFDQRPANTLLGLLRAFFVCFLRKSTTERVSVSITTLLLVWSVFWSYSSAAFCIALVL